MERITRIDPNTLRKRLIPIAVRRQATTARKARTQIPTITVPTTEISTIAISTGLGLVFLPVGNYPSKRESRTANNFSVLRHAPLGKVTMEAAPAKEAAKKRRAEKRLATAGAPPVGQPGSEEEVSDERESEDKSRNEKQDPYFYHRKYEERKHYKP